VLNSLDSTGVSEAILFSGYLKRKHAAKENVPEFIYIYDSPMPQFEVEKGVNVLLKNLLHFHWE
jgi:hypothetical protein